LSSRSAQNTFGLFYRILSLFGDRPIGSSYVSPFILKSLHIFQDKKIQHPVKADSFEIFRQQKQKWPGTATGYQITWLKVIQSGSERV
jgi:hypothetical protein